MKTHDSQQVNCGTENVLMRVLIDTKYTAIVYTHAIL